MSDENLPDFSYLAKAELKTDEAHAQPYQLAELEPSPTIWFKPASSANKEWMQDNLRRLNAKPKGKTKTKVTMATVKESRQEDKEQLAKFCATRWEGVLDSKGQPVPFSAENCLAYFEALPDYIFDGIRMFTQDPANWAGLDTDLGES